MKSFLKIKHLLLKNFNNQNIYINITQSNSLNLIVKNANIKIEENIVNFLDNNEVKFSINLNEVKKTKISYFQIIFYFSNKQIKIEI